MSHLRSPALDHSTSCVWLTERSQTLGQAATLDDVPDARWDRLAELGPACAFEQRITVLSNVLFRNTLDSGSCEYQ